jgi:O-methyltransferase/IclR-like helix-turn-helix domain-containing protein
MSTVDTPPDPVAPHPTMTLTRLIFQQWKWEATYVAARLNIAEALADGPRTVAELAKLTGTHAPSLHRLLRALSCIGIFAELDGSRFVNTELSQLLRPGVPGSFSALTKMDRNFALRSWGELLYSVQTGKPGFDKAHGMPMWRYYAECDPAGGALFNEGMASFSAAIDPPIAQAADLSEVSTVVDVGGGHGSLLTTLLAAYPSIKKGILFEQPHVIDEARDALATVLNNQIELQCGDFFTALPAGVDVYVMKWILHDWDDTACLNILTACRHAMPAHGRLLAVEVVLDANQRDELVYSYDLQMLLLFGSKERTIEEYRCLYDAAGLRLTRVIPTSSMFSLIEGVPQSSGDYQNKPGGK